LLSIKAYGFNEYGLTFSLASIDEENGRRVLLNDANGKRRGMFLTDGSHWR
jgi:hypothetical protein